MFWQSERTISPQRHNIAFNYPFEKVEVKGELFRLYKNSKILCPTLERLSVRKQALELINVVSSISR